MTDAELVEAIHQGDSEAFCALWSHYGKLVRRVIQRELGSDASCEDLAQDVFLALLKNARNITDPCALRSYVVTIALRLAIAERRRRRSRESPDGLDTKDQLPAPPRDFEGREALRALDRVLDKMSQRRRLAFMMRCVERMSVKQTARALGISEATTHREVRRARQFVVRWSRSEPALKTYSMSDGACADA